MRRWNLVNASGWFSIAGLGFALCVWDGPAPDTERAWAQSKCPPDCPHFRSRAPRPLPAGVDQLLSPPQCSIHGKRRAGR
jgi:hypothetical protein